jgi:hypothetical protein
VCERRAQGAHFGFVIGRVAGGRSPKAGPTSSLFQGRFAPILSVGTSKSGGFPMNTPVIVLDFNNHRVLQVVPGNGANERELEDALKRSKQVVTGGFGASPPTHDDQA